MPQKRISPRDGGRWLSLVALAALISSILVITGGASQGAAPDDLSANVDPPSLVLADSAAKPGAVPDADGPDRLVVELVADDSTIDVVAGSVVRSGGVVLGVSPETLLVEIGTAEVRRLTASGSPIEVRPPSRVDLIPAVQAPTAPDTTRVELTQITNASAWHDAGLEGEGVAVGIVDYFRGSAWSAAEGAGSVPTPAGTFCRVGGVTCDIWSASSEHGVGVAEMVHAMAPRASVYLATVRTVTDLAAAVEWFDSQGVDIITRSLGAVMDGAGDGTGPLDSVVDDAVGRGMA